jgi:sirohydrochlorin cobaltochelatase
MAGPALILFGHGARDPEWALPFKKIQSLLIVKRPDLTVELAFLEFMAPSLEQTAMQLIAAGHQKISVAPIFIAQGGHLKHDLPQILDAIRAAHPSTTIELLPALGDVESLLDGIAQWLSAATPAA